MDPAADAVITPHLLAGETILWCGRPRDTPALRRRAIFIAVVGAGALALRAIAPDSALAERAYTNSIMLAVLVVILIAEAMVFHAHLSATFYGVTNQRVIIVSGLRERRAVAILLDRLNTPLMQLRRRGNSLEIRATAPAPTLDLYVPFTNPSLPVQFGDRPESYWLIGLDQPRRVYDLIVESAHKLTSAPIGSRSPGSGL
ncbi:MAG TPA: hypothetical protein VEU51_07630 [Candidatus Acidoferrales bacterium]|nr:hypothetical protein [Candidatus Acidoferrales bacterium]